MNNLLLFLSLIALVNSTSWGFMNSVSNETTIFVCRTAQKISSQPEKPKEEKTWISDDPSSLAEKVNPQISKLAGWLDTHNVAFEIIVTSNAVAAVETANSVFPEREINEMTPNWNEVDLGFANGLQAGEIKKQYAEYHPGEIVPDDANDCLNEAWTIEGMPEKKFEAYNTAFKIRIMDAIKELHHKYPGKVVVVFTHCEDMRDAFMLAKPTEDFLATKLSKELKDLISDPSASLGESISRPMFKPDYASAIKLTVSDDSIAIEDAFNVNPTAKAVKKD